MVRFLTGVNNSASSNLTQDKSRTTRCIHIYSITGTVYLQKPLKSYLKLVVTFNSCRYKQDGINNVTSLASTPLCFCWNFQIRLHQTSWKAYLPDLLQNWSEVQALHERLLSFCPLYKWQHCAILVFFLSVFSLLFLFPLKILGRCCFVLSCLRLQNLSSLILPQTRGGLRYLLQYGIFLSLPWKQSNRQ